MVGNIANFTKIDLMKCFLKLSKNISRKDLAKELGLGEGTVRTMLDILKSNKIIESNKTGHFPTKKGEELMKGILQSIEGPKTVQLKSIYPESIKVGILIKECQKIEKSYKLRDISVKNGADGAIILRFSEKIYTPDSDSEQDYSELDNYFKMDKSDVLVICFSSQKRQAENGAFAIAAELSDELKKFISLI